MLNQFRTFETKNYNNKLLQYLSHKLIHDTKVFVIRIHQILRVWSYQLQSENKRQDQEYKNR